MTNEDNPLVLNFAQKQEYSDEHLVGVLDPQETHWNPGDDGEIRRIFHWYPRDHVQKGKGDEKQKNNIKKENFVTYPSGTISPREVNILLPDGLEDLPEGLDHTSNPGDVNMGAVLGKIFYTNQALIESLKSMAEQKPEILEEMKDLTMRSELDEANIEKVVDLINSLEKAQKGKNSSSDDS